MASTSVQEQITKYEYFVDVILRGDLQKIYNQHEKICERVLEYMNIKSVLNSITENNIKTLKSMSDIGSNCYVKCVIPNTNKIILDIGLNCFLELKLNEAANFIEQRVELYNKQLELLIDNSAKIKAHIKLILSFIDQLKEAR